MIMSDQDIEMVEANSLQQTIINKTTLHNPLDFDLQKAVNQLNTHCHNNNRDHNRSRSILDSIDLTVFQKYLSEPHDQSKSQLLNTVSQCLLYRPWTLQIIQWFRPLAIDLIARIITPGFMDFIQKDSFSNSSITVYKIELVAKTFALTLPIVPQVKSLAVSYFMHSPSLFERLLQFSIDNTTHTSLDKIEIQDLLFTAYQLLHFSTNTFAPIWNWGTLVQLLNYPYDPIRFLTVLCLAKVYNLSDLQTKNLLNSVMGYCIDENEDPIMATLDGNSIDLRMLSLWEQYNIANAQICLTHNPPYNIPDNSTHSLTPNDLCSSVTDICGILMAKPINDIHHIRTAQQDPQLILTDTTSKNLHAIALALSIGAPTLLEGVTGAGKTTLVEDLAIRTGRGDQLVKIHLGDQTDPKVLLGTYVSTSTPGSFRWQSGVLTTAVQEGRWVLIEDIDLAPAEVLSVLLPLLETKKLFIPSRGEEIKAKEGFHLFGTRSLIPSKSGKGFHSRGGEMVTGANLWTRVHVDALSITELEQVVREKFKYIGDFTRHVIELFETIMSIYQDPNFTALSSSTFGRFISTRDLMKYCYRIDTLIGSKLDSSLSLSTSDLNQEVGMDESIRLDLFSEAVDCFCGMISDYATWVVVLEKIGEPLQLSPAMVRHYIDQYKPSFDASDIHVRIGRVNLTSIVAQGRQKQSLMKREKKRPFATTNHALRLMERIGVSIHLNEPVLLVGETGTGKTTVVQHLADMMHQTLVVVNMSQQSDSSDLLGGFKPVDGKVLAIPIREDFEGLFEKTFSIKKNAKFLEAVRKSFIHKKWKTFVGLLDQSIKMSQQKFRLEDDQSNNDDNDMENKDDEKKNTGRRVTSPQLRNAWKTFERHLEEFKIQQTQSQNKFVFSFMEGSLVKAVRNGDWILMDEINLATTETLECLSGLLENAESSLLLTEKGDLEPIKRHPNFRLFACMNPATDVGKRDLPPGLRNRFTEFYVHSPDSRYEDLLQIVRQYISPIATGDERACEDVAQFYMEAKKLSQQHKLVDGANQRPHFSIRTLSRALTYVCQIFPTYGLRRSLYEGFCMTFLTQLSKESEALMHQLIYKTILNNISNPKHLITQIPRQPQDNYIQFGYFWLEQGQFDPIDDTGYIMTPSVETKLYNLARVIMSRKFPVLIQGPTSAGKTSMIEYLAKKTGHRFVRINNHEHTDLQEYLGTYVSNNEGKLVFQEGVLVEALRNGYWIVLDELNLAPSDVLEALNRLLDDNRELLIPETQEIVKPHPHFMLFATQNPAGLYGGRKALSRAFRNRFLELHFDDIPEDELETILSKRCRIAPSYCKKLVQVYKSLMERRQSTRIFEQRHGFITLRDLFRWAGRDPNGYQELAEHGYMLLAERCRRDEEKKVVKQVLESVMKVTLNENEIYDTSRLEEFSIYDQMLKNNAAQSGQDTALVWTKAMKRLFTLVARCLKYNEPVLLVGDTGCGKTTVCQMLAETYGRELHIVNCHQNTETGDLLGGQRPVRQHDNNRKEGKQKALFEWHDGPLVQSMRHGHLFLLDEISLADDSVLERLNSVLEPSRLLVLAEKGGKHVEELYANSGFQFFATMNPGGDYGKKELSPALRNRFTEIWVPAVTDHDDLSSIINEQFSHPSLQIYTEKILNFIDWYMKALGQSRTVISLRDILSWVKFINTGVSNGLDAQLCFVHGCCIVLLDGLGSHGSSGSFLAGDALKDFRLKCLRELVNQPEATEKNILGHTTQHDSVSITDDYFGIGPFHIPRGKLDQTDIKFTLLAPTTSDNAMRVIRSMQLKKPILLEGSPGVGKTSLISALAAASGHNLVRINLSEQTDLMDLFGSDLPVEGGNSGEFAWRDAPFLQAMKAGDWVLLDELNLASQSVLEGLNSCLDHRGAVYIPELDREFFCAHGFRVFGAQNPLQQGGGRKGLPKSFVNRFTQVYVEHLTADDLLFICTHLFSEFEPNVLQQMIDFNTAMYNETMIKCSFGRKGSPWEFNLRDVFRWLELMQKNNVSNPMEYLDTIYIQRMRTHDDRLKVIELYETIFNTKYNQPLHPQWKITPNKLTIGNSSLSRLQCAENNSNNSTSSDNQYHILQSFLSPLQSLMKCVESGWMAILTGPSASGKTSLVRLLSKITGNRLEEFAMNNSVDTMELLGGFEQVDLNRHRQVIIDNLRQMTNRGTQVLLDYLSALESTSMEERQKLIQQIRQLNDAWFALEKHQQLQRASEHHANESLDYSLLSALLNYLNNTCSLDKEASVPISQIVESIKHLQQLEKDSVAGKFEWIDGLLINALENGHWLLIDNANLCNPSVLDRLNPLFENNGVLMVNERGLVDGAVKVIKPHPNFRMFMTVDPQNGELSRAMRNRGIEITLVDSQWNNNNIQDVTKLANGLSLRGPQLPLILNDLQEEAALQRRHLRANKNVRDYLLLVRYIIERLQRGQTLKSAIQESFYQVFVDIKEVPSTLSKLLEMDVEEDILQNMLSPTNCHLFIGGSQLQQDSRLATVALQGAYFLHTVQQLNDKQQHLKRIEIAGDYFLEMMSMEDYGIRLRWLAFAVQHCPIKHAQQIERLGYLTKLVKAHSIFLEWSKDNTCSLIKNGYKIFIRLCKQEYAMTMIRNASQRLKVTNLTAIQQSYCLQEGRISESQLLHPIVAKLYPYFNLVYGSLLQWINERGYINSSLKEFDWINDILDLSDFAWDLIQSTTLPLDNLLIILRSTKELMSHESFNTLLFTPCRDSIDNIMSSFNFEISKSMKELWKYFGPATLSSKPLYELEKELIKISTTLNSYDSANGKYNT
ncbi:P-loop containing nucleoside triphosphate hydrolase protein [Cunninghamella echinulata]|nr:P-loop containing nucleoside triphosphate hydrolase protein [Cunninghamella echinulata]